MNIILIEKTPNDTDVFELVKKSDKKDKKDGFDACVCIIILFIIIGFVIYLIIHSPHSNSTYPRNNNHEFTEIDDYLM